MSAYSNLHIDEGILRRALGAMGYGNVTEEEMLRVGHRLLEMEGRDEEGDVRAPRDDDAEEEVEEEEEEEMKAETSADKTPLPTAAPILVNNRDQFEDQFIGQHQIYLQNNISTTSHSQAEAAAHNAQTHAHNHSTGNDGNTPSRFAAGSAFRRVLPPPPLPPAPRRRSHQQDESILHPGSHYFDPVNTSNEPPVMGNKQLSGAKAKSSRKKAPIDDLPLSNFINAKGEYRHQQRFKPYVGMESKRTASSMHQHITEAPAAARSLRPATAEGALDVQNLSKQNRSVSRPATAPGGVVRMPLGALSPNESQLTPHAFLTTHASNVIYAYTDNANYRSAGIVGRAPFVQKKRPQTDVVAKGRAMREAWSRDGFLSQKQRKDERWEVRRSMLSVPPQ